MAGNEIVERVRRDWPHPDRQTVNEAAAEIERLQAEVERLSAALECARLDLNHLAEKYGEQEFIAPTICKITALGKGVSKK